MQELFKKFFGDFVGEEGGGIFVKFAMGDGKVCYFFSPKSIEERSK
jgi:hypothetical protein